MDEHVGEFGEVDRLVGQELDDQVLSRPTFSKKLLLALQLPHAVFVEVGAKVRERHGVTWRRREAFVTELGDVRVGLREDVRRPGRNTLSSKRIIAYRRWKDSPALAPAAFDQYFYLNFLDALLMGTWGPAVGRWLGNESARHRPA
jgi:hypothetical protein